ncbi:glycosyltransferase [uncultured Oscillibacter sp.]|uniref:glycosyltransferase n=1 Tax=uncultured Oscillibacter sp. TaxID=876091 RepID=UPI0025D9A1F5|nr:glycosyltransferase [uncultured Oscillibacter sp.]
MRYGFGPEDLIELHLLDQRHPIPVDLPEGLKVVQVDTCIQEVLSRSILRGLPSAVVSRGPWYAVRRALYSVGLRFGKNSIGLLADDLFPDPKIHECDVCFVLKEDEPILYYALTRVKSRQTICFFHTADLLSPEYAGLYQSKAVDKIVTVSQGNRDFLCRRMPKAWDKISVIHNIVPPEEIRAKAAGAGAAWPCGDVFHIVSVCRVDMEKGVDIALKAAKLLDEAGADFCWHIIGPFDKGHTEEFWLNESKALGTEGRVVFEGAKSDPYPDIKAADLLVNASRVESFGMAIREAQILGTPVISTDTYGGRELIDDGITGILVPVGDPAALAAQIGRLIEDPGALAGLVQRLQGTDFDETAEIKDRFAALIGV